MKIFVHMPYAFNAFYGKSAYIFTVDSLSIHSAVFFVVSEKWNNIIEAKARMLFFCCRSVIVPQGKFLSFFYT